MSAREKSRQSALTREAAQNMHGERFAVMRTEEQSQSSVWLCIGSAATISGNDAVVLPETAAPQAAGRVDMIHSHSKAV